MIVVDHMMAISQPSDHGEINHQARPYRGARARDSALCDASCVQLSAVHRCSALPAPRACRLEVRNSLIGGAQLMVTVVSYSRSKIHSSPARHER